LVKYQRLSCLLVLAGNAMFQFSRWLSIHWFILLPLVSWLATAFLYRSHRRNLADPRTLRWLLVALIAHQVYVSLLIFSSFYETVVWIPAGAIFAVLIMALAAYLASSNLPRILPNSQRAIQRFVGTARNVIPYLLAVAIASYVLSQHVLHWSGLWLILLVLISPLIITIQAGKRLLIAPLSLILIALVFSWQSVRLREMLPPGYWRTLMPSASCSSTVQLELDREYAWCTDETTGQVYRFSPRTGFIDQGFYVEYGSQAFSGNANQAWIMQNPTKGLVLVEDDNQVQININLPRQGTLDTEGRLWVVDVSGSLWVSNRGKEWTRMKVVDGLLDNTAEFVKIAPDGSVWVGSYSGVSILSPGQSNWRHITRRDGIPGTIIGIAFSTNDETWYLWNTDSDYQESQHWGVSRWDGYRWIHIELGAKTGLDIPLSQHAVAVDGMGRVWFVAPSYKQQTNYMGVITPYNGVIELYVLGPFELATRGYPVPGFHGVIDDGNGGIFLYNPTFAPIRHWRPNQEYQDYNPCPQPCTRA